MGSVYEPGCICRIGAVSVDEFFVPGVSIFQVVFLTLMVNIRYMFYGLTFLKQFHKMGKRKWYMIFTLTDETYSLLYNTEIPDHVDKELFLFAVTMLNHCYWIIGSVIGSIAGNLVPFDLTGIDFALTALYVVMFVEQWQAGDRYIPLLAGVSCALAGIALFGGERFIFPAMLAVTAVLLGARKQLDKEAMEDAS